MGAAACMSIESFLTNQTANKLRLSYNGMKQTLCLTLQNIKDNAACTGRRPTLSCETAMFTALVPRTAA